MNYSICVSGAAAGDTVQGAHDLAERLGVAIAKSGHYITTGATVGLPMFAARAAKEAAGRSIGFSPASSLREHVNKYRLPMLTCVISWLGPAWIGLSRHNKGPLDKFV